MAASDHKSSGQKTYRTTRPVLPPTADRKTLRTHVSDDLLIELRPSIESDAEHIFRLRSQIEVMRTTSQGTVDADLTASATWLKRFVPPNDKTTFNYNIWVADQGAPWEHIGVIGVGKTSSVCILGYMIRREWWGRKIVTSAIQAWLQCWWALDREVVELEFEPDGDKSIRPFRALEAFPAMDLTEDEAALNAQSVDNDTVRTELLVSEVDDHNVASRKILARCGFEPRGSASIMENGVPRPLHVLSLKRPA